MKVFQLSIHLVLCTIMYAAYCPFFIFHFIRKHENQTGECNFKNIYLL